MSDYDGWYRVDVEAGILEKTGIKGKLHIAEVFGQEGIWLEFCVGLSTPVIAVPVGRKRYHRDVIVHFLSQWLLEGGGGKANKICQVL